MTSPLEIPKVDSLEILFSKDPDLLTEEEQMKIVLALRADRARWVTEEKKAKTPKKAADSNLSLGDLEL